ncbi:hypothetical protein [Caballeronia sp. LZ001]|uniref:hypothetical protein n=1 Tax=Caballeronia sp. LZ001 TaxID=3038553 RepID=UPI00285F881D|nr:hypothetical protein [Caballeronia sp. LZ001]MDR5801154.1 hypothetical protein [Caballeronia sp. LZ001]
MKRYTFTVDVTSVSGYQVYYVDADNEDDARTEVQQGGGVFVFEEFSVEDLGTFELSDVSDIPEDESASEEGEKS